MTDVDDTKTVAVLGLGNMGGALAEALLSAGFSVIVWNRTPSKSVPLVKRGARVAKRAPPKQRRQLTSPSSVLPTMPPRCL